MDGRRGQDITGDAIRAEDARIADGGHADAAARRAEARGRVTMWTFVAVGPVFALTVLAMATGDALLRTLAVVLCVGASITTGAVYRRVTGDVPPAIWQGPVTLWAIPLVLEILAAIVLVRPAVEATGSSAPAWILAAVVAASSALYGVLAGHTIRRRRDQSTSRRQLVR
jgi:hypothetical protein